MADYQKVEIRAEETPPMAPAADNPVSDDPIADGFRLAGQEEQAQDPRPEWLPEKFESPEALAYAYDQLQKEFSKARSGAGEDTETEDAPPAVDEETFNDLSAEFDATGDVSEESRARLAATGIPRPFIDQYIEGQKILAETAIQDVYKTVGGENNYSSMLEWATNNLSEQEIDVFNDMVAGSPEELTMAVNGMYARYIQSGGTPAVNTPLVQGDTTPSPTNGSPFQSRAQIVEAMSDPRYKKDPAFRDEVYRRLQNSRAI